jgi:cellulose synthase/poly-beta-1,6-N-acetylglucosamine synthase-like glycosyltransferase
MDLATFWLVVVTLILFIAYAILISHYKKEWQDSPIFEVNESFKKKKKVSVIVPARNEASVITACLTSLQNQTYPNHLLEIIVVDDHSDVYALQVWLIHLIYQTYD